MRMKFVIKLDYKSLNNVLPNKLEKPERFFIIIFLYKMSIKTVKRLPTILLIIEQIFNKKNSIYYATYIPLAKYLRFRFI